jgi:hypothetical protein
VACRVLPSWRVGLGIVTLVGVVARLRRLAEGRAVTRSEVVEQTLRRALENRGH